MTGAKERERKVRARAKDKSKGRKGCGREGKLNEMNGDEGDEWWNEDDWWYDESGEGS